MMFTKMGILHDRCLRVHRIQLILSLFLRLLTRIIYPTALRFVQGFSEDDILNRLHEIRKGNASQVPISIKFEENMDMDGISPNIKQPHCSFCGHPGNKRDHMKLSCEICVTNDSEGCLRKPEGFKCGCSSCGMNRKHKEQKRLENWHTKFCDKIAKEPNFPKNEIIDMYLCNDNGYFSEARRRTCTS